MEEGMQLIDENGNFNVDGLQDFVTATEFAQSGLSYAIVAIIGSQSSGKSTLLNQTFHTKFKEMDAYNGRSQTTKGIWIAKCSDIDPFTIVMDFEGTDSNQRGEDDAAFERQSTLFALEIADVVLINMWCKDIGLEHAASRPLLKTVFQVIKRSFKQPKKTLLFVIRDHTKTPLERLKKFIFEDIEKIWDAVPEPETTTLYEFFKVEITALPSYEFQEVEFKEQVAQLRQQFVHSTCPGGLVGDRKKVKSVSFSIYAEDIWKTIKENKDLDLPSIKVMVATFRCEAIAEEKLKCFTSNKSWLAIKEDVQAGPVPRFGEDVTSILETCLSEYDIEVGHFDQEVQNAKRQQLLSNVLMVVHDAYDTMLMHLYSNTVKSFKTSLQQSLNEGREYVASIHLCSQSCLREFDEGCEDAAIQQSGWNANKFRKRLICNMLSEISEKAYLQPICIYSLILVQGRFCSCTDLVSKSVAIESKVGGTDIKVGGMAKGSGMIHPNMATMLGVITTDALVNSDVWRKMVQISVNRSFNQITVDGDTSTNDTVIALASGLSGSTSISNINCHEAMQLQACLDAVMQGLAKSIAWDGEGATCLIEVTVTGAESEAKAAKIARSVASSSLVKAAVYGRDPNWGRIAAAAGYAGIPFHQNNLRIMLGDILLMDNGQPLSFDRSAASNYLRKAGEIHGTVGIYISVGDGPGSGQAWGCDLSYDYVKINAEYTT